MSATAEGVLARLYPSMATTPSSTESAAPVVAPAQSDASAQPAVTKPVDAEPAKTDEPNEAEKELAKAQRMYPPEKMLENIKPTWPVEMSAEQQEQYSGVVRTELGRKLMMGPEDAQAVVNVVVGQPAPTAEQQAAWKSESEIYLRKLAFENQRYGVTTAELLRDAKAYLARSPTATKLFTELGYLNHPKIVQIAVERGRAARIKGLLK